MSKRNSLIVMTVFVLCGAVSYAQIGRLDKPVTVMETTELKIERGTCFIYWKSVFCTYPGDHYRLEVLNSTKRRDKPVRSYSVTLCGSDVMAGPTKRDPAANWEGDVHLEARSILKVTLRGEPGAGIVMRIWGEAGKVTAGHIVGSPQISSISPQSANREPSGSAQAQGIAPQQAESVKRAERPLPTVSLQANKESVKIGQAVRLTWDAQNADAVRFTSGDLGRVEDSGSALIWPEKDTLFRIEATNWDNVQVTVAKARIAAAEATVRVEVPDPELMLKIEPSTVISGQEVTMTWKTKNARIVRYGEKQYGNELDSYLPPSGKKSFKPTRSFTYVVQAENAEKTVQKTISVEVKDAEAERQRIEREKMSRNIPKKIDKALRGIWDDLKEAMRADDPERAAGLFCRETRADYLAMYKQLKGQLPQIGREMRKIEFLEYEEGGAKYRTKRKETIKGKEYDISYYVYFVIDPDGQWRIYRF